MTVDHRLMAARHALTDGLALSQYNLSEGITQSWQRCLEMGLDPSGTPRDAILSDGELGALREASGLLMGIVRPELELLSSQIAGTNHLTAFADANGVVLDAIVDHEFHASDCSRSIRPGSIWSEEVQGTNALGLALYTGRTSMVTGGEHFFESSTGVSCVSSPICASDGQIVGLLDASSEVATRQDHTRALVNLAATNIENRLFIEAHRGDHIVQFHPRQEYLATQSIGLVAFDENGVLLGKNRSASRLLDGVFLNCGTMFADLFQGSFHALLGKMQSGDVVQIRDRLNASYAARLRPGARSVPGPVHRAVARLRPADRTGPGAAVFDDEQVRESLRVSRAMLDIGQPVCIAGARGVGKTRLAEELHTYKHSDRSMFCLDCRKLRQRAALGGAGIDEAIQLSMDSQFDRGGTLLLENISALKGECPESLAILLDDLRRPLETGLWSVLATETLSDASPATSRLGSVRMHRVSLPQLASRTDFHKIVRVMIGQLSQGHEISVKGLKALQSLPSTDNLWDLRHYLQVLLASCPAGVLRDTQIEQLFPRQDKTADDVCPRCRGNTIREQRCREIRRTYRACQHNVALTARRLGIARNTVYLHLKS